MFPITTYFDVLQEWAWGMDQPNGTLEDHLRAPQVLSIVQGNILVSLPRVFPYTRAFQRPYDANSQNVRKSIIE